MKKEKLMRNAINRFWGNVWRLADDKCWEWAGKRYNGYGRFSANGKTTSAHRFSWELHNGPIPPGDGYHGTCVRHKCDNRACVNPNHLELGTHADNMQDRCVRGHARGIYKYSLPVERIMRIYNDAIEVPTNPAGAAQAAQKVSE